MNSAHISSASMNDTIAAIATPPGTAGIAVIRISGPSAIEAAASVFSKPDVLRDAASHTLHHGDVLAADGTLVDDVVMAVFRKPHSYSGENSVEISCHGGTIVTRSVLDRVLQCSIRHAEPGEFTRRAFLNGKIDLMQAEAVADLIHAQSEHARRASAGQLRGALSVYIGPLRDRLVHAVSMLELGLDFVEEDVAFMSRDEIRELITATADALQSALSTYRNGRIIRDGVKVALTGAPNVGKSSLLNALLGIERAIVTEVPGTTRDYIEEARLIGGELFRLIDTAGLHESGDIIERRGMEIAREMRSAADIVLVVHDSRGGIKHEDPEHSDSRVLNVYNKADLIDEDQATALSDAGVLLISARTGRGLDDLIRILAESAKAMIGESEGGTVLVTNARHAQCLRQGLEAVRKAEAAASAGMSEEFIAAELRIAADQLGEMIGAVTPDDILNSIFSRFCIGK